MALPHVNELLIYFAIAAATLIMTRDVSVMIIMVYGGDMV